MVLRIENIPCSHFSLPSHFSQAESGSSECIQRKWGRAGRVSMCYLQSKGVSYFPLNDHFYWMPMLSMPAAWWRLSSETWPFHSTFLSCSAGEGWEPYPKASDLASMKPLFIVSNMRSWYSDMLIHSRYVLSSEDFEERFISDFGKSEGLECIKTVPESSAISYTNTLAT